MKTLYFVLLNSYLLCTLMGSQSEKILSPVCSFGACGGMVVVFYDMLVVTFKHIYFGGLTKCLNSKGRQLLTVKVR